MEIRRFDDCDEAAVIGVWERCGLLRPWNDPVQDIARKRQIQPELFWVAVEGAAIVGTIMAGYDGHRGWLYCVGVDPIRQRKGVGTALLRHAERELLGLGCAKINLQVRSDNIAAAQFYTRYGFAKDPVESYGKRYGATAPDAEFPTAG